MDSRIKLKVVAELKSSCYFKIIIILIKRYMQWGRPLLTSDDREELLRKQHQILHLAVMVPLPKPLKQELSIIVNKMFSEIRYLWIIENFSVGDVQGDFLQLQFWNFDISLKRHQIASTIVETPDSTLIPQFCFVGDYYLEKALRYWDQMEEDEHRSIIATPTPGFYFPALPNIESLENLSQKAYADINIDFKGYFDDDALPNRLKELNPSDQMKFLMLIASTKNLQPEKMRFCLSLMDLNQQNEVCRKNPASVLRSLLTWPYYHQFLPVANAIMKYLTDRDFCKLLANIIKDINKWPEPEHIQILKDFWELSPESFKMFVRITNTYTEMQACFERVGRIKRNNVLFPVWGSTWEDFIN